MKITAKKTNFHIGIIGLVCLVPALANSAENAGGAGKPDVPVQFVRIDSGVFNMGSDAGSAAPMHRVRIDAFKISKTLVTVEQYAECVQKRRCAAPESLPGQQCNWGQENRRQDPVNCVSWKDAMAFAKFKGARLPSEAEYEYAATSGGTIHPYPWGADEASCDRTVMLGCADGTMPVCSKSLGNTKQGLCDMTGNVSEWIQDNWHASYSGAPSDGSAWENTGAQNEKQFARNYGAMDGAASKTVDAGDAGFNRMARGGSINDSDAAAFRADSRFQQGTGISGTGAQSYIGFRVAKSRSAARHGRTPRPAAEWMKKLKSDN